MSAGDVGLGAVGRRVRGPSALGSDPQRFWQLTRSLAVTDFKLRFFGSVLGYLWQLMRPLMLFGVLYVIFAHVVRLGGDVEHYPVALLLGIVLYTFVSDATGGSVTSLIDRENLVRKIEFPRLAVPAATVLTALFNLALNLVAVLVFMAIAGVDASWSWLQLPLIVVGLVALAAGLAMLLSTMYVSYRDVKPIWDVTLQLFFYASPIFYTIDLVLERSEIAAHLLLLNPFAALLQQARHALLGESHPTAAEAIGGGIYLLGPAAITLVLIAVGARVFTRRAPRIAEQL